MKIYISGPISGRPWDQTRTKFNRVADYIIKAGHTPVNPTDTGHWGLSWDTYMQIAGEIIRSKELDAIYMLSGWDRSKGARLERIMAMTMGIPVIFQDPKDKKTWGGAK